MKPSALTKLFRTAPNEVARLPDRPLAVVEAGARPARSRGPLIPKRIRRYIPPFLVIVLPTLLAGLYYGFIASDQYLSEARFLVRGQSGGGISAGLLGALMMSGGGGALHSSAEELTNVADYMQSHDALRSLEEKINLADLFRRPEADFLARLETKPTAEDFLEYYQNKVVVAIDTQTGIASMKVRAFRPEDSQLIAETLLMLGEDVVNHFSDRQRSDTLKVARDEVQRAEARLRTARENLTEFRDREAALDPARSSALALDMIAKLDLQLAQARTELTEASTYLKPDSAKYISLRTKAEAIQKQIADERQRLTGSDGSMAPVLAKYERLVLEREFADKGYASALISMESARSEAAKQHLYLVRVVEPNLPEKALYPRRLLILTSLFVSLCFTYGIGWLIIAGIREHSA
jgi:capsular polysaccharide transport system permease protein